jgi:hypothetical protein
MNEFGIEVDARGPVSVEVGAIPRALEPREQRRLRRGDRSTSAVVKRNERSIFF